MATITGSEVLAQALRSQGVDTMFYLMGGPMLETEAACIKLGICSKPKPRASSSASGPSITGTSRPPPSPRTPGRG